MKNFLLKCIVLAPILMAFQCGDEFDDDTFLLNEFKVTVSPSANFNLSDTIWISGRISSNAYAVATGDSIFFDEFNPSDRLSVMKLKEANPTGNSIDAIDRFELIKTIGNTAFSGICTNADLVPVSELSSSTDSYEYKIGLVSLEAGSYVLSWERDATLTNTNRHTFILEDYKIDGRPNELMFNRCGSISTLLDINESNKEYFFTVE